MIELGDEQCLRIIEAINAVIRAGNGDIRVIVQNYDVLDVIPSPRKRISKKQLLLEETIQGRGGDAGALGKI